MAAHAGITFDEDFFHHPVKRVESERRMEQVLHERFGRYGPGADRDRDLPVIGAAHRIMLRRIAAHQRVERTFT